MGILAFMKFIIDKDRIDSYKFRVNQTINELTDFKNTSYFDHFETGYYIFLNNKLTGTGVKSFRHECSNEIYNFIDDNPDKRCRTHPQLIHRNIIRNRNIRLILLLINFYLILRNLFNRYNFYHNFILYLPMIYYFWPIKTSGVFFQAHMEV